MSTWKAKLEICKLMEVFHATSTREVYQFVFFILDSSTKSNTMYDISKDLQIGEDSSKGLELLIS